MKILFLTNNLVLPGQPGVPRPWRMASHFKSLGHEVTVVTNRSHYLKEDIQVGGTVEDPLIVEGIRVIGVPTTKDRRKSIPRRLLNYASVARGFWRAGRQQERPDLIVVSIPPPVVVAFVGWMLRRRFKAKSILDVRDLYPHSAVGIGVLKNRFLINLWQRIETFLQNRYDHLVAVVPRMKPMIAEHGVDPDRITVITNGYDMENDDAAPLTGEPAEFYDANKDRFIACYGGGMGYANHVGLMIAAADILRDDPRFVFAIFGDGDRKKIYAAEIAARGLTNTRLFPSQTRPEISTAYRRASALMHGYRPSPLWEYALPNKMFEYHGAGRPIVFAGTGEIADMLERAGSGIATRQDDAQAFAEALRWLADNPEAAEEMGRRGRDYIIREFRREAIFARWDTVIEKIGLPPRG